MTVIDDLTAKLSADLGFEHIEGYAQAALDAGGDMASAYFNVPLISHIEGNLYVGGYQPGITLPDEFGYVVSLYAWASYGRRKGTGFADFVMRDAATVDELMVVNAGHLVSWAMDRGPVLVHCQAGLNRSNLVAAYALMLRGRTADEAITLLRERRSPAVLCNRTFESWLRANEVGRE